MEKEERIEGGFEKGNAGKDGTGNHSAESVTREILSIRQKDAMREQNDKDAFETTKIVFLLQEISPRPVLEQPKQTIRRDNMSQLVFQKLIA